MVVHYELLSRDGELAGVITEEKFISSTDVVSTITIINIVIITTTITIR